MSYEIELPNYVLFGLQKDKSFFINLSREINNIFNTFENKLGNNKNIIVLKNDNQNESYLIHKEEFVFTIYKKDNDFNQKDLFSNEIKSLNNSENIYISKIISFCFQENPEELKQLEFIHKSYAHFKEEDLKIFDKMVANSVELMGLKAINIGITNLTYRVDSLINFCEFIENNFNISSFITKEQISKYIINSLTDNKNPLLKIQDEMLVLLNYLNKRSKNYSNSKKYTYNDLDNHLYAYKNGFFLIDQNFSFYIIPHGKTDTTNNYHDFQVYAGAQHKRLSEKELKKAIKDNSFDYFYDITIEVKDGKIVYFNPSDIYNFYFNLKYTAHHIEEYENKPITYPIDISSFEYQKDYFYSEYNTTKIEFLSKALLVLGSGFTYDSNKGVFYCPTISYLPNLRKEKPITDLNTKINFNSVMAFNSSHLKKIKYLNEDWFLSLVELKENLNTYKITNKRITENEFVKLEMAIVDVENLIKKLQKNKLNTKNKP